VPPVESPELFRARVARMTAEAAARPSFHRRRIVVLATLAYAYLFGVMALLLVVTLLLGVAMLRLHAVYLVKLGIPLLILDWIVIRSLWVRLEPPTGRELLFEEAPQLDAEITRVRRALGVNALHRTFVTGDLNAAVVQHPTLGILGGYRNYLVVGLPLLQALSREEFVAVLAHEFGHLSGNHGRFGAWMYRVRGTWSAIFASLEEQGSGGARLFRGFIEWFAPLFSAATFVLARQQEYEADRCAAEATDARTAATALVRLRVAERQLSEEFWPEVGRRVAAQQRPSEGLLAEQAALLARGPGPDVASRWAGEALLSPTDVADTHPSLSDRLRALGVPGEIAAAAAAKPLERSAAEELLGESLAPLRAELDESWRDSVAEQWRHDHEVHAHQARQLEELRGRDAAGAPLDDASRWDLVQRTLAVEGPETATPLVEAFLTDNPAHAGAQWTRGQLALARGDESGLASLEATVALDVSSIPFASALAYEWLHERGRIAEADAWRARGEHFEREFALANEERASLPPDAVFEPHGLDEAYLETLRAALRDRPMVEKAWLVRRRVEYLPGIPSFVLLVWPVAKFEWNLQKKRTELLEDIGTQVPLPEATLIALQNSGARVLERRLRETVGAPVYTA
jgi:Zn-dependent protease with chaperone function